MPATPADTFTRARPSVDATLNVSVRLFAFSHTVAVAAPVAVAVGRVLTATTVGVLTAAAVHPVWSVAVTRTLKLPAVGQEALVAVQTTLIGEEGPTAG